LSATAPQRPGALPFLRNNMEIVIAILLGLVSIATAFCSFQSTLYGGQQAQNYTDGTNLSTEAESLYLEGNQQYVQDAQLFDRLTDLKLDIANPDAAIAAAAQIKYDTIYFQSVSPDFDKAIKWADDKNASDPALYYSPLDNEDYQTSLFGTYKEKKDLAVATVAAGALANNYGDKFSLATVIMAVSLFLLGIGAVAGAFRIKMAMAVTGIVIFLGAVALAVTIPFLPLF